MKLSDEVEGDEVPMLRDEVEFELTKGSDEKRLSNRLPMNPSDEAEAEMKFSLVDEVEPEQ